MLLEGCEVFNCEQGSEQWFAVRCGVVTASTFSDVMAKGRAGAPSETRRKLLYATAAEIVTGKPAESFQGNRYTDRGKEWESEVRSLYSASTDDDVTECGFIRRGRIGYSPDSCVGENGGLEIKTHAPHILIPMLERGVCPPEHRAQIQGGLLVTGWQWIDLRCYCRGLPQLEVRVHRDLEYLGELSSALNQFHHEVDAIVARLRSYA
jgi:hypothetical protein